MAEAHGRSLRVKIAEALCRVVLSVRLMHEPENNVRKPATWPTKVGVEIRYSQINIHHVKEILNLTAVGSN